jgi:hypothetical protein
MSDVIEIVDQSNLVSVEEGGTLVEISAPGPQGPTGAQGPAGPQGAQGAPGADGITEEQADALYVPLARTLTAGSGLTGGGDLTANRSFALSANQLTHVLGTTIDGGGSAIETGAKGFIYVPFACVITGVTLLADQAGSIVIDIWKDTYANHPPTDADSITAAAPPTIAAAVKSQDNTLTGWSKNVAAGDVLRFNVDSCTDIQYCTLILTVTKS